MGMRLRKRDGVCDEGEIGADDLATQVIREFGRREQSQRIAEENVRFGGDRSRQSQPSIPRRCESIDQLTAGIDSADRGAKSHDQNGPIVLQEPFRAFHDGRFATDDIDREHADGPRIRRRIETPIVERCRWDDLSLNGIGCR